jgi:D-arabinose 1-dehydrogenase-like Zn-dependent alcohol dehydrogenase
MISSLKTSMSLPALRRHGWLTSTVGLYLRPPLRQSSTAPNTASKQSTDPQMKCWQLNAYSKTFTDQTLTLTTNRPKPVIHKPSEVMVRVWASSVNPIDVAMSVGYGRGVLDVLQLATDVGVDQITHDRLPLILGRDFCGEIYRCGHGVRHYRVGQWVYGSLPPFWRTGSHCEFIVADESHVCLQNSGHKKCFNLDFCCF